MKKFLFIMMTMFLTQLAVMPEASANIEAMRARLPALVKAKESGMVGEQQDGLVGVVSGASDDVKALISAENADRLKIYKERASSQDQELGVFMKVMGEARIESEKAGRFIQSPDGSWKKK